MMMGEKAHSLEITQSLFRKWEDHPQTVAAVAAAGKKLADTLSSAG